jgi:hypothetical protein
MGGAAGSRKLYGVEAALFLDQENQPRISRIKRSKSATDFADFHG